ncbi:Arc family DNA-binding protein [bacterium]|nr:Arc family DNA-binding protein [bacterium]
MAERKVRSFQLRLPPELKTWIEHRAEENLSSQNSEIVRAVRAAMICEPEKGSRTSATAIEAQTDKKHGQPTRHHHPE